LSNKLTIFIAKMRIGFLRLVVVWCRGSCGIVQSSLEKNCLVVVWCRGSCGIVQSSLEKNNSKKL